MEKEIISRLTALGHPHRLAIFRLLIRRHPDLLPAGELAQALSIKPSTLSAYLSTLMQARLVTQKREATSLLYSINMDQVRGTFDYLLLDCCRGRPDLCSPFARNAMSEAQTMSRPRYKVLFICTGNSARSIFAESILQREAAEIFDSYSAGTSPSSELNPIAIEILKQKGHDISRLRPKNITEFQGPDGPSFDFVFSVCDTAANEDCPAWSGQPVSAHWGMPDPVRVDGTDAERSLAFQQAYGALLNRIKVFAELPLSSLDRISLQKAVDDIGRSKPGTLI